MCSTKRNKEPAPHTLLTRDRTNVFRDGVIRHIESGVWAVMLDLGARNRQGHRIVEVGQLVRNICQSGLLIVNRKPGMAEFETAGLLFGNAGCTGRFRVWGSCRRWPLPIPVNPRYSRACATTIIYRLEVLV